MPVVTEEVFVVSIEVEERVELMEGEEVWVPVVSAEAVDVLEKTVRGVERVDWEGMIGWIGKHDDEDGDNSIQTEEQVAMRVGKGRESCNEIGICSGLECRTREGGLTNRA